MCGSSLAGSGRDVALQHHAYTPSPPAYVQQVVHQSAFRSRTYWLWVAPASHTRERLFPERYNATCTVPGRPPSSIVYPMGR